MNTTILNTTPGGYDEEATVTITKEFFDMLMYNHTVLESLQEGGVDNWDGWEFAMDRVRDMELV